MSDEGAVEGALIAELRALAGAPAGESTFTITRGAVRVGVEYRSGSASTITLSAPYGGPWGRPGAVTAGYRTWARPPRAPRPLMIQLEAETASHVRNKARGIDREVQTWDPEFDREIYIDTAAPDEAVAYVLSQAAARNAARALLVQEGFLPIHIDDADGMIRTTLATFAERTPLHGRGARIVDSFVALVEGLPPVEAHGEKPFDRGGEVVAALGVVAGASFLVQFFGSFVAVPGACISHDEPGETSIECVDVGGQNCCTPMGVGAGAGLGIGLVLGWLASRPFRGTSRSSGRRMAVMGLVTGIAVNVAIIVAEVVMW